MLEKIVSIVSGGLDSISFTAPFLKTYEVHCLAFDYGQKGVKELEVAEKIMVQHGCKEFRKLDISFMKKLWRNNQITDDSNAVKDFFDVDLIVPLRNAIFLTIGAAYAYTIGAKKVIYGSQLDDIILHTDGIMLAPDCSPKFASLLEEALYEGHIRAPRVTIESPASLGISKSENIKNAFNILKDDIFTTWSCFHSGEAQCGKCEACHLRKTAFKEASIKDKTKYLV